MNEFVCSKNLLSSKFSRDKTNAVLITLPKRLSQKAEFFAQGRKNSEKEKFLELFSPEKRSSGHVDGRFDKPAKKTADFLPAKVQKTTEKL